MIVIFSNDAKMYTPKRKRSKVYEMLKRKTSQLLHKINDMVSNIDTSKWNIKNKVMKQKRCKCKSKTYVKIIAWSVMAMETKAHSRTNNIRFDTDSAPVGINNRCTGCISHVAEDFIGQLNDSQKSIKGFGGTRTKNVKVGTLLWRWIDDNGKEFKFHIPNSYYVPSGGVRLLSPQHWAKTQQGSKKDGYHGILSQTTSRDITLMWNNRQNK